MGYRRWAFFLFYYREENGCFGWADGFDFSPSITDGLENIVHLQWVDRGVQLFHLSDDGVELLLVGRMGEAGIEARSIAMVDGEADGAAVVEGVELSTVSKASGETALLEHLAGEGGEDMMESFVEEHCLGDEAMRR